MLLVERANPTLIRQCQRHAAVEPHAQIPFGCNSLNFNIELVRRHWTRDSPYTNTAIANHEPYFEMLCTRCPNIQRSKARTKKVSSSCSRVWYCQLEIDGHSNNDKTNRELPRTYRCKAHWLEQEFGWSVANGKLPTTLLTFGFVRVPSAAR